MSTPRVRFEAPSDDEPPYTAEGLTDIDVGVSAENGEVALVLTGSRGSRIAVARVDWGDIQRDIERLFAIHDARARTGGG